MTIVNACRCSTCREPLEKGEKDVCKDCKGGIFGIARSIIKWSRGGIDYQRPQDSSVEPNWYPPVPPPPEKVKKKYCAICDFASAWEEDHCLIDVPNSVCWEYAKHAAFFIEEREKADAVAEQRSGTPVSSSSQAATVRSSAVGDHATFITIPEFPVKRIVVIPKKDIAPGEPTPTNWEKLKEVLTMLLYHSHYGEDLPLSATQVAYNNAIEDAIRYTKYYESLVKEETKVSDADKKLIDEQDKSQRRLFAIAFDAVQDLRRLNDRGGERSEIDVRLRQLRNDLNDEMSINATKAYFVQRAKGQAK